MYGKIWTFVDGCLSNIGFGFGEVDDKPDLIAGKNYDT